MNNIYEIGTKIKLLREQKGLSQRELGKILGCPQTTVANWERQIKIVPRKELIKSIATVFNVPESYLLGIEREKYFEISYIGELKNNCIVKDKENQYIEVTESEYAPTRFVIKISDNSFEPFLQKNDFCIIDNILPKENDIVLVVLEGKSLLKKWKENKKRIALLDIKMGFEDEILFVVKKKNNDKIQFSVEGKKCFYKGKVITLKRNLAK